jgi:PEP-CTERM motif
MYKQFLSALAMCLAVGASHAADPSMSLISSSVGPMSFEEYSGASTAGAAAAHGNTFYFVDEKIGALGKSWYLFFEPSSLASISATFTFDGDILGVFSTRADLNASNAEYGVPGVTYGGLFFTGLGRHDSYSFSGNVLTLNLRSFFPGDHVRIFTSTATATAVPEPATYVLLAISLVAVGFIARRRKP